MNLEEDMYLQLLRRHIPSEVRHASNAERIDMFEEREDRTGVGTYSSFGNHLSFSLKDGKLPILTTKKVWWKGVLEELLFFIAGETDSKKLEAKGVSIWLGNTKDRDGDIGPAYGYQWRNWPTVDDLSWNILYDEPWAIDQLQSVIDQIKTNPHSRRHVVSSWNVAQLNDMALPPCHILFQFYVHNDGGLSCQMYQRSADLFLGVPFNIASYGILTHLVAHVCGLKPHTLRIVFGDTHLYKNHLEPAKEQIKRTPTEFPRLHITRNSNNIDDYVFDDFVLQNYNPQPAIKAPMAV